MTPRCTRYPFGFVKGGKIHSADQLRTLTAFERSLLSRKRRRSFLAQRPPKVDQ